MTAPAALAPLSYYGTHGAALFPIPAGQKNPTGIVASFALDCSRDPAQWERWAAANPGCNWGVVAGASGLIIVDIDVTGNGGRDAAWSAWCALCVEWGLPGPLAPHVQSARGGWHVYCAVPPEVDARTLRQPDAIKGLINIRAGNGFTVAAGSFFEGLPYVLLSTEAPHPAPAALIAHCTRASTRTASAPVTGSRDPGDVANLVRWLAERDQFGDYESWVGIGMAIKLELGDAGREIWALTHDGTVTDDVETTKWNSFATEPTPGVQTLATWLDRAHRLGWRGTVRKSAAALFDGVASIAAAAGASLPVGAAAGASLPLGGGPLLPLPSSTPGPGGVPMLAGQAALTDIAAPIIAEFLAATGDSPSYPVAADYPTLPESCSGHGLYEPLRAAISRIIAMGETPKTYKATRASQTLAVLQLVHLDVFEAVARRLEALGCQVPRAAIKRAATALSDRVERTFVDHADWHFDIKGCIENDNSDNVVVFLGVLGCEIRWNGWLERAEIRGGNDPDSGVHWPQWTYIDDAVVAKLRTRANRTKTRFRPAKEFLWESLLAIAQQNSHDPALDRLAELAAAWDGKPRLSIWLAATCGVSADPYHQAVGRNVIGGMVRRIRHPGCKHDTMAVLYGPQGTGKSTLATILAPSAEWFTDTILLGDAAKELVLSLAGKCVVEIGEMGMRGSANASQVKAMISRQVDAGRTAYARSVSERPRRNIFVGTTNDDEPLSDPTGNRRFLPVRVDTGIDLEWLRENIGQLVGEAAALEARGETFALPPAVWGLAADHQEAARSESDAETLLYDWFAPTEHTAIAYIVAADLVHLSMLAGWRSGGSNTARGSVMKRLGFRNSSTMIGGKRTRIWARSGGAGTAAGGPLDITRVGVRYMVGVDAHHRPRVTIAASAADVTSFAPGALPLPNGPVRS